MTSKRDWDEWERRFIDQVAEGIREARAEAGLSQRALAERASLSQGAINNLESGTARVKQAPSVAVLIRIAVALGVPPVQLLYPDLPAGRAEVWPSVECSSIDALQWFSGEVRVQDIARTGEKSDNTRVALSREYRTLQKVHAAVVLEDLKKRAVSASRSEDVSAAYEGDSGAKSFEEYMHATQVLLGGTEMSDRVQRDIGNLEKDFQDRGWFRNAEKE